ncbi:MAG: hypothetical protein ACOYLE_09085 [Bacteroidales bacterium]|jgi:hypothetical protein
MKNPFGSRAKVVALSLLILANAIIINNASLDIKYWIALSIIFVSLLLINYECFILYNKTKNK